MESMMHDPQERIEELKQQIDQLKRQFPAHSIPPAMMLLLDELEEELERLEGRGGAVGY